MNAPTYYVGIGCSAGGLKALEILFKNTPKDTGFVYLVCQHLSVNHKSLMTEILSRYTQMEVLELESGQRLKKNTIYVVPAGKVLRIENEHIFHLEDVANDSVVNHQIDSCFKELALKKKQQAIGVILSGTGSDGTEGCLEIRENKGLVAIQNPKEAQYPDMPKSIHDKHLYDIVTNVNELNNQIVKTVLLRSKFISEDNFKHNRVQLMLIIEHINRNLGLDFSGYKTTTLFRRLFKRLDRLGISSLDDYLASILEDTSNEEIRHLVDDFLINVTDFFRDKSSYDFLAEEVIPKIVRKPTNDALKFWVSACSTGQEAYTLAMLIDDYMSQNNIIREWKIFGTDIDDNALAIASKGGFHENLVKNIPENYLNTYFTKEGNTYIITPNLRKKIIFCKHDIIKNPPFNNMDFISSRNMLIYLQADLQELVLNHIHYSLLENGYLMLGSSETLGTNAKNFHQVNNKYKVYKNLNQKKRLLIRNHTLANMSYINNSRKRSSSFLENIAMESTKMIAEQFSLITICVDDQFEIIHAAGKLKEIIDYPEDGYSNNLLKIVNKDLSVHIANMVRKITFSKDVNEVKRVCDLYVENELHQYNIHVKSIQLARQDDVLYMVNIFMKAPEEAHIIPVLDTPYEQDDSYPSDIIQFEKALSEARSNLQSTIEDLESANEEMQVTNEELLSSNEELQSTNEELQSLNEELHTVNTELQEKNMELVVLNSDIENLMKNINISTIFLDDEFKIRKYTPIIKEHYPIRSSDKGRSISHFSGTIPGEYLVELSRKVLENNIPYREDIQNKEGHWYAMNIFPYKNVEDQVEGVVINFININDSKNMEQQIIHNEQKLRLAINGTGAILWECTNLEVDKFWLSQAIDEEVIALEDSNQKMISIKAFEELVNPDHLKFFRKTISNQFEKSTPFEIELMLDVEGNKSYQWFNMSGQLQINETDPKRLVGTLRNIHKRKVNESNLKKLNAELERFAYLASHDMKEPLKTISSFSKLVKEEYENVLNEDGMQYLDIIQNASQRMLELTSDLLKFSLLKHQDLKIEEIKLGQVVREIEHDYHILISDNKAEIKLISDGYLTADHLQLKQLLSNLIENAIKYRSEKAPVITIALTELSQKYQVTIKDNGIGIAEEYQKQIFEIFKRLENSERKGTGIGLANCKRIVENHHGEIKLTSAEGEGTEFRICFPKVAIQQVQEAL